MKKTKYEKHRILTCILSIVVILGICTSIKINSYASEISNYKISEIQPYTEYHVFQKFPTVTVKGMRTVSCYVDKECELRFMYNFAYTTGNTGTMTVVINNDTTGKQIKMETVAINKVAGSINCGNSKPGNYTILMIPNDSSQSCIEITQLYTLAY